MSKSKRPQIPKKSEVSLVRSSAAEYLTFVAATGGGSASVEMRYEDENLWLTQKMMATLYDVSVPAVSQHLKRIYADNELEREATVKPYLMVQTEGEREVQRKVDHYSLQAIIAVGFKIENERAVQFRKWANQIVKDYTIQGWVMDADRLKSGGSVLTEGKAVVANGAFNGHIALAPVTSGKRVATHEQQVETQQRQTKGVVIRAAPQAAKGPLLQLRGSELRHPDFTEKEPLSDRNLKGITIDQLNERLSRDHNIAGINIANHVTPGMDGLKGAGQITSGVD